MRATVPASPTDLERHALRVPAGLERSPERLAAHLIAPTATERERARVLFRWIAARIRYDDAALAGTAATPAPARPEAVLDARRAVCDGYAALFARLAALAGLEAVVVHGLGRGGPRSPSRRRRPEADHAWNAVRVDGRWGLVDCTWGAGHLDPARSRFVQRFEPHYFLTPPEQFIHDHWPSEARWQLLEPPVAYEAFAAWLPVKPAYFRCGLSLAHPPGGVLHAGAEATVPVDAPPGVRLWPELHLGPRVLPETRCQAVRAAGGWAIHLRFPHPGRYTLRLFAAAAGEPGPPEWAADVPVRARHGTTRELAARRPAAERLGLRLPPEAHGVLRARRSLSLEVEAAPEALLSARVQRGGRRLEGPLTFLERDGARWRVHALFGAPGRYLLKLYVKREGEPGGHELAASLPVDNRAGAGGPVGFPEAFAAYHRHGARLLAPLDTLLREGHLRAGRRHAVRVLAPGAREVALESGRDWVPLRGRDGAFEATVRLARGPNTLYARYGPDPRRWDGLLCLQGV